MLIFGCRWSCNTPSGADKSSYSAIQFVCTTWYITEPSTSKSKHSTLKYIIILSLSTDIIMLFNVNVGEFFQPAGLWQTVKNKNSPFLYLLFLHFYAQNHKNAFVRG